jgi:type II secretory pathway predicted ATPase ExeA
MENFLEFFGFEKEPFETNNDLEFFYYSYTHRKGLNTLFKAYSEEGITLIIGDFGTGKTTLIKKFIAELKQSKYTYIEGKKQSFEEIVDEIIDQLEIDSLSQSLTENLNKIKEFSEENKSVLIIDNAHELSVNVIEKLRILTDTSPNLRLILAGNRVLENIINLSSLRQLKQRVKHVVRLRNLTRRETKKYIETRIYSTGTLEPKISNAVFNLIHSCTKGNPFLINLLMEEVLFLLFQEKKKKVKKSHVRKSAKNLKLKCKTGKLLKIIIFTIIVIFGLYVLNTMELLTIPQFKEKEEKTEQTLKEQEKIEESTEPYLETQQEEQPEQPNIQKEEIPQQKFETEEELYQKTKKQTEEQNIEQQKTEEIKEKVEEQSIEQKKVEEKKEIIAHVKTRLINIREEPSTRSTILAVIPKGYEVKILEEGEGNWVKVLYYSKRQKREIIGWVNKKYLEIAEKN